ncbi:hypothetical protein D0Y65_051177 [Glycine soja]|uniref:Uncharacterized protein n=1 Tax=Glycine soja TaxID=3848 RepID=A0A445FF02_GLYSO|nr:hypothetical protein D0Y65_051177 [Glycine soja]
MTLAALASLRQVNEESLKKFMDRFGCMVVQIQNLNPKDFKGIKPVNQDDPMVVSIIIENFTVSRVFIDQGSPLLSFAGERVEIRGYVDLMTTVSQGKLSKSFTIKYLLVDTNTPYFVLIDRKALNELGAIVSTPHLSMKFPTLTGKIVTINADQKQARQCYAESLKVAPYPPIRESAMPHHTAAKGTQVMTIDERSQIRALTIYQSNLGREFNIDPQDDTSDRGLKPIEELVQLQLGPKPRQCTQLSRDLTSHEHRRIIDVLC